jgi:uncharacterized membrane protein (UPF0127 family)
MSGREHFLQPLLDSPDESFVLRNARTNQLVVGRVEPAFDSRSRRRGLLGRSGMSMDEVLIIAPGNAIHTFSMGFAIDVVFVNRAGKVLKLCREVRPGRIAVSWRAFATLEFAAGVIDRAGILRGDRLCLEMQSGAAA